MHPLIERAQQLQKELRSLGFNSTVEDCIHGILYVEAHKSIKELQTADLVTNERLRLLRNKPKSEMKPLQIATISKHVQHVQQLKRKPIRQSLANLDMTGEDEKEPTEELKREWRKREQAKRPWEK